MSGVRASQCSSTLELTPQSSVALSVGYSRSPLLIVVGWGVTIVQAMTMYGLYIRDLAASDLVWFTTEKSLEPGTYRRGRHHADSPDVYIAESTPALVLQVGPLLDEAENLAQFSLSPPGTPVRVEKHIATEMTGLASVSWTPR